jgi:hypothetical protein
VSIAADTLFELDPQKFMLVPGNLSRSLLYTSAKLQRDVPEFRPRISLHEGLADAYEYLSRNRLIEEAPPGDWEDQLIEIQLASKRKLLGVSL